MLLKDNETKRCSKCKERKPKAREYFYVDTSAKRGFKSRCKICEGNSYAINDRHGLFNIKWKEIDTLSGIYKITCTVTRKFYIGSAVNICMRWSTHLCDLRKNQHMNKYLQNSFNKYGEESFKFEIIESILSKEMLVEREQFWLDELKPYDRKIGFNILKVAGSCLGKKLKETTKDKLKRVLNKPVLQFDLDGNLIALHISAKEAKRQFGFSTARIYNCANRKIEKYKGFIWIYESEKHSLQERIQSIKISQRTIVQYNLDGVLIKEWNCSISKIAEQLGKTYINIPNCCNGNHSTLGGFIWRYRIGKDKLNEKI
ncbi:GIY-YIG nuclease family protein [Bacillus sp. ISL-40]|uniref:GIY-YIG nuclease family protein n=1 Tax=Bacillus sp. ISL-40 TaxID=2819126 RepID=UPI001BECD409|nr:GIY-YIG nuclease family protein [Bacillus sp. ISL-40]MBT2697025.1 GIY-YIG nuclease family protein [Bacillus sp. ISL-40]